MGGKKISDFGIIAWIAVYYEVAVLILMTILNILVIFRYRVKKNKNVRVILISFLFYEIAMVFSLLSKIINAVWGGVPYENLNEFSLWWIGRIHSGRFGSVFFICANILSYKFSVDVFRNGEYNKKEQIFIIILSGINIIYQIFIYEFNVITGKANQTLEIIAFALILLHNIFVWFPFMRLAFKTAEKIDDKKYKKAFRSLGIMALGFIGVFVFFVLDRLMLILFSWAYSTFYFIIWICALIAISNAYFGYIRPKED